MTKSILALAFLAIVGTTVSSAQPAQQSLQQSSPEVVTIKPKLLFGDVKNVHKFIDGVEIRGTEVDAFLDVKKMLTKAIDAGTAANKKDEDQVVVEMRMDAANNFYVLMQRATLKGAEAEKYRQIIASVQEAAKEAQSKK